MIVLSSVNCGNPGHQIDDSVVVNGFRDLTSATEGNNVTFTCLCGFVLIGPSTSTCMANGMWKPDPKDLVCKGKIYDNVMCKQ